MPPKASPIPPKVLRISKGTLLAADGKFNSRKSRVPLAALRKQIASSNGMQWGSLSLVMLSEYKNELALRVEGREALTTRQESRLPTSPTGEKDA